MSIGSARTTLLLALVALQSLVMAFGPVFECSQAAGQGRKSKQPEPTLVRIDKPRMLPSATIQSFVGSLEPVRRSVIGSAVEERVQDVLVQEGDFVDVDNGPVTLVRLRNDTIDIEVRQAEIELESQRKALEELSVTLPSEISAAEAEIARLDAQLQFTRKVYQRIQSAGSSISRRERDEAFSNFNSATQAMNLAKGNLSLLTSTRQIRLARARQNVERAKADLDRNLDLQHKHDVAAPFSGYVSRRLAEKGNWVTRGTPLVELVQIDPIQLRIQVPQEFLTALLQSVQQATEDEPLTASIALDSQQQKFTGTVYRISPDADLNTRSVPVIIRIDNPLAGDGPNVGHLLKPGLIARADIQFGTGEKVMMVPKDALVLNQGKASIFAIDRGTGKPVARKIAVETGNSNGNWIQVTGDLGTGQEVVTQGNERLRPGETVRILSD